MDQESPPLTTIQRAIEIMDVLRAEKTIGVSELARRMNLPKSTVHDYLRTLVAMGYVVNEDGEYSLGLRLLELGGHVKYRNRLFHVAKPELERLVEKTGELASVNVEERGRFVILHTEFGSGSLRLGTYPGLTTPIHTHAAGKVMLAEYPLETTEQLLDERDLEAVTDHTITDREELLAELAEIRERGYGVDWNEQVVGMGVVAAAVRTEDEVLGSLGVVCPTGRLVDEEYQRELAREVQNSANVVSVNYQYSP